MLDRTPRLDYAYEGPSDVIFILMRSWRPLFSLRITRLTTASHVFCRSSIGDRDLVLIDCPPTESIFTRFAQDFLIALTYQERTNDGS